MAGVVNHELIAKHETNVALRFNPAPKQWRGKARLVTNSQNLVGRMRRSMIVCRLNQLATQAAKQGDSGISRAYQPRAEAARAIQILLGQSSELALRQRHPTLEQRQLARDKAPSRIWRRRLSGKL
jgi:hypothetical protein